MNRLHPSTMIVAFLPKLYDAFRQVLPFLAISYFSGRGDNTELFVAAIGVLGGFGAIAAYWTTRYGIQDGHLVCTSGWLFKRDRRLPLEQIQNVNLKQGVLERIFKVVTVEIETAASSGAELKLQVITDAAAEDLRRELSVLTTSRVAAKSESEFAYVMSRQDLILGAMTENQGSQVVFALIGTVGVAALSQFVHRFVQFNELIPSWILWATLAAAILAIWVMGWLYGGIQYAVKYARFSVRREPGLIRISHGFLTKLQFAVRLKRVELASISSTVWQRLVGRCTVRVGTAGTFGEEGATVPIALMLQQSEALPTIQSVMPGFNETALVWKSLPRYYLYVTLVRSTITLAILGGVLGIVLSVPFSNTMLGARGGILAVLILFSLWTIFDLILTYRKMAYAVSDEYLAVRGGFFRKTSSYMPVSRIDTVGTSEPSWWRKRGVTSLVANGMVQSIQFQMLPIAEANRIRALVISRRVLQSGLSLDLSDPAIQSKGTEGNHVRHFEGSES